MANNDQAGCDADTRAECRWRSCRGVETGNSLDDGETGAHGALGVILVGDRIAEIDQHPVAHVSGHEAPQPCNAVGDAAMIGFDHVTKVLGVQSSTNGGGTYQVAEHDCELAAFSRGGRCKLAPRRQRRAARTTEFVAFWCRCPAPRTVHTAPQPKRT